MMKFSYIAGYLAPNNIVHQYVSDYYFDDTHIDTPELIGGRPTKEWFTAVLTDTCREASYSVVAEAADNFHKSIIVYAHIVFNGLCIEFHKEYDHQDFIDFEDMAERVEDDMINFAIVKFGTVIAQLPEGDLK